MRIAIDATSIPARPGGAGYYIINLVQSLLEVSPGEEWLIFVHPADRHLFNLLPIQERHFVYVADYGRVHRLIWEQVALPGLLKKLKTDVLLSPHYTMPLRAEIPVVVTFHDMSFFLYREYHTFIKRYFFPWMIRKSAKRAAHILTVSESTRCDAIRILNTPPERITTVPLGCSPGFRRCTDPQILDRVRQKYHLPQNFFLNVGTIEPRKNQSLLIEAFHELSAVENDYSLVVAGDPAWHATQIKALVNRLGIHDKILLTGYVDRQDMPVLYSLAQAFIYPSIYEGFGLPVLEAMACGTLVITSNISSLPEIVGDAGLLISPFNRVELLEAMRASIHQPEMVRSVSSKGEQRAALFTWHKTGLETLSVLRRVVGK